MAHTKKVLLSTFFVALTFLSSFLFSATANSIASCPKLADLTTSKLHSDSVSWVVDGDTLHTTGGKKLRLLHINAPEFNPNKKRPVEYFATESQKKLSQLAPKGSTIFWTYDHDMKDSYGRDLAFVFNQKGQFVNQQMVISGNAQTLVVPPNQKYWRCINDSEKTAIKLLSGMWQNTSQVWVPAKKLTNQSRFQLTSGTITRVVDSKKYRWLILDDNLWVGIKRRDFKYFAQQALNFKVGERLSLKGYIYHSYGHLRLNIRHPSMISKL